VLALQRLNVVVPPAAMRSMVTVKGVHDAFKLRSGGGRPPVYRISDLDHPRDDKTELNAAVDIRKR